jgi:hypothetical protein
MLKTLMTLALSTGLFLILRQSWADCTVNVIGPHAIAVGESSQTFATEAEAEEAVRNTNIASSEFSITCSNNSSSPAASVPDSGGDAGTAIGAQMGTMLGNAIVDLFKEDDQAAAQEQAHWAELQREEAERKRLEEEKRREKYEADKTDLLNNLRDSDDSGKAASSSGDSMGLRDVGDDSSPAASGDTTVDLRAWKSSSDDGLTPDISPWQIALFQKIADILKVEAAGLDKAGENYDQMTDAEKSNYNKQVDAYVESENKLYDEESRARLQAEGADPKQIAEYIKGLNHFADPKRTPPPSADPAIYQNSVNRDPSDYATLAAASKDGQGSNQVGAGLQSHYDCGIFALSNAAETPYGMTSSIALEKVTTDYSLPENIRKDPVLEVEAKGGGLNSMEMFQTAHALGNVKEVDMNAIPAALAENQRPIVVGIQNPQHYVAISRTFESNGEQYYQVMDSEAKKTNGITYWKKSDLESVMATNGIEVVPEAKTVAPVMGGSGNLSSN